MTTEVINGKTIKMRDDFRVYGSYEEAIADYINLLTENPRYKDVKKRRHQRLLRAVYIKPGMPQTQVIRTN